MQFCYRGTKYNLQSNPIKTIHSDIQARFLGKTYTVRQACYQNALSSEVLKYRGVVYQK
mgnify:CR=1 FL=1